MIINGTTYHNETPATVINVLETARNSRARLRIFYGDTKTGRCWNDENDIFGRIGRSTGTSKIPLLVYNKRSMGGPALLDNCIIRIVETKSKKVLYTHPNFNTGHFTMLLTTVRGDNELQAEVYNDGKIHARFKNEKSAKQYIKKMRGE